jgi:hypothetical protein
VRSLRRGLIGTALSVALAASAGASIATSIGGGGGSGGGVGGALGATDNAICRADGAGGVTVQGSDITLSDTSANVDTIATGAGHSFTETATPPAQTSTSQAGVAWTINPMSAVAGSSVNGAASGGNVIVNLSSAARLNSGNGDAGLWQFNPGALVGSGNPGGVAFNCANSTTVPCVWFGNGATTTFGLGTRAGGTTLNIMGGGGNFIEFQATGVGLKSNGCYSIGSGDAHTGDTFACRSGTANIWQNGAASATAAAGGWRGQSGTGSDKVGGAFTVSGGAGTGAGAPGDLNLQTAVLLGTGSTGQSFADRLYWRATPKTLTESSATAIADIAVASGSVVAGTLEYTVESNDGTDFQSRKGTVPFSAVNKAGTLTTTLGTVVEIVALSAGTLTCTPTITTGANKITLNLNAVSSLSQTTLRATWHVTLDGGSGAVSPL